MTAKVKQFPLTNSNPMLSVAKNGVIIYSNEAGETLLHEWGVIVGEKLPIHFKIFVQRAISRRNIEKIEISMGKKIYFVVFHPLPEQKRVNIYGFDISGRKKLEGKRLESETQEKTKLELANIIDTKAVQSLMDDFYTLAHIPMALLDIKGNILVSVGWQEICTKFHRANPEACKHCVESDINITMGVAPGGYKLYKCKNNMWDVATPITVEGQHVGNVFTGQFFFDEEPLNYELFRDQARKYGFNEEEYVKALEKVPRLSRKAVDTSMAFLMTFANMISQLSYSNIKLSQSLAERDEVVDALRESEKRERARSDELAVVLDAVPVSVYIAHDPQALQITGNRLSYEWLRVPIGTNFSKSAHEEEKPKMFKLFKNGIELQPEEMPSQLSATGIELNDCELEIVFADGQIRHVLGNARPLYDEQRKLRGSISAFIDITERKRAEEAVRLSNIYNRSLIEASLDPLVTIGHDGKITDVNNATEQVTGCSRNELIGTDFSDYFTEPERARAGYQQAFMDGEVRDYLLEIRHKDGYTTPVLYNASVYRDENGKVIGVFAVARDITERKRAEEALKKVHENLEKVVEERTAELEKAYNSLKESEKGLAEAQKMAHIGNWEWDIAAEKAYWSEEMYRIFGRDPQELAPVYNEFLNCIHPDDRDYVDSSLKKAVKGKTYSIEHRIVLDNGEERAVHMQSQIIFDDKNNPVRIKGIVQDITERKKSEEKIQNLANVVESSTEAIISKSFDGIIKSWNKGAEQIYGYSAEKVLGKSISILEPPALTGETERLCKMVQQGEKVQQYETLRLRKDGKIINVSLAISPVFDNHRKIIAASIIATDVTRRKSAEEKLRESEEKYRNIVETSNEGIYLVDDEAKITYANKIMETSGYPLEEIIGRPIWDFISEESMPVAKRSFEKRRQGINDSYELKLVRRDGSFIWGLISAKSLFNKEGKFIGYLGMLTDITQHKQAEEVLANLESARKKEIHHRIKNNLQVISSLLDLQAGKFDNPKVIEAFRESQNRVISMALIHEELYKGERTDTLDFSTYIRELAENLFQTYSFSGKNIHLRMDLEENAFLDMDVAVPLGIIVNELVSNSLKHAFPGRNKGEIRIELHRNENGNHKKEDDKATSFILIVSDNGTGIPENFNIEDADSLGIQLVTALVDQLDGELELKRNNGTEFTVKFTVTEKNN